MSTSLTPESLQPILWSLASANGVFNKMFPGEPGARQPVQTVYGGAHLFKSDTAPKLGAIALRSLDEYAPTAATFSKALQLKGSPAAEKSLYIRILEKL